LTVNKKTMKIASGVTGLLLAASACKTGNGSDTYDYEVSGIVQGQQVDYDCPNELSMDAVAFVTDKGGGGKSSGKKSSSDSSSSDSSDSSDSSTTTNRQQNRSSGTTASKAPSKAPSKAASTPASKAPSTGSGTSQRSASPSAAPSVKNKGVKLKKKPEKPEKLKGKKLPKVKYKFKPKGCETEYEIFVLADDGYLYEQDVRKADYDNCVKAKIPAGKKNKLFPLCTKG
jgi:hypothetical protein